MDKTGALAVLLESVHFDHPNLLKMHKPLLEAVSLRPEGFKGKFIKNVHISSTMSPSLA